MLVRDRIDGVGAWEGETVGPSLGVALGRIVSGLVIPTLKGGSGCMNLGRRDGCTDTLRVGNPLPLEWPVG